VHEALASVVAPERVRVISPDPVPAGTPPAHGTAVRGHAVLFKLDKQKKDGPAVAYRLLGSGFIGSTSWTLAAIGAVLFSLGILAALMSSPPID
jgi:hypothetical protein